MWEKLKLGIGEPDHHKSQKPVEEMKVTMASIDGLVIRKSRWNDWGGHKRAEVCTHPTSKLLYRNSLLRTATHLFHHRPLAVRHVHFAPHMGGGVCSEHAATHFLRIQKPMPC